MGYVWHIRPPSSRLGFRVHIRRGSFVRPRVPDVDSPFLVRRPKCDAQPLDCPNDLHPFEPQLFVVFDIRDEVLVLDLTLGWDLEWLVGHRNDQVGLLWEQPASVNVSLVGSRVASPRGAPLRAHSSMRLNSRSTIVDRSRSGHVRDSHAKEAFADPVSLRRSCPPKPKRHQRSSDPLGRYPFAMACNTSSLKDRSDVFRVSDRSELDDSRSEDLILRPIKQPGAAAEATGTSAPWRTASIASRSSFLVGASLA